MSISRYTPEIFEYLKKTEGKAVYCFVINGNKGTGGMPLIAGFPEPAIYRQLCEELILLLRRSADMLEKDVNRQVPITGVVDI